MPPKVIFTNKFVYEWNIGSEDLLSYYSRPSAFTSKTDKDDNYDLLSYMGNKEKSEGLFNEKVDLFSEKDIEEHRRLEMQSQLNGCPKHIGVISFDNSFLEENNLLVNGMLNTNALRNTTRKAIAALIKNDKKIDEDNVYWCGAIHVNTDNVHIHLSILEKERREDKVKKYRDGDMLSENAMDKMKSAVINSICKDNPLIKELSHIERELLLPKLKESYTNTSAQMYHLISILPPDRQWQYNRPKMSKYHSEIDNVVDNIISSNETLKKYFDNYEKGIDSLCDYYRDIYGAGYTNKFVNYKSNKLRQFYERAGNALLNNLKRIYNTSKENDERQDEQKSEDDYLFEQEKKSEEIVEEVHDLDTELDDIEDYSAFMKWDREYKQALNFLYGNKKLGYKKDIPKATDMLTKLSSKGNVLAMCDLANLYKKGLNKDIGKNEDKAYKLYRKAFKGFGKLLRTENNSDYIYYRLGKMCEYGNGVDRNEDAAVGYYKRAENNKYALYSLGTAYKYGKGVVRDDDTAYDYYFRSCSKGNAYATYAVAQYLEKGIGDNTLSYTDYYESALDGFLRMYDDTQDDNLAYKIGTMYLSGNGCKKEISSAEKWFDISAQNGNENALYQLAKIYLNKDTADEIGYQKRRERAIEILARLSLKGNENAAYILGKYYYGQGQIDLAEKYYIQCCEKNEIACYQLGKIYLSDEKKDLDKAIKYFTMAANKDNGFACYQLGKIYLDEKYYDDHKAEYWLSKSCECNNEWACYKLGAIYLSDKRKMIDGEKLLLRACENDNHWAYYRLGKHYVGTNRVKQGIELLKKSQVLGNEYAGYAIERTLHPKIKVRRKPLRIHRTRASRNYHFAAAFSALNSLYAQYEYHVKQLQAEYERDIEQREFENEYYIEYGR